MDITTKNKISKAMKGSSNFEGKRHTHTAKLAIASARRGKDNIKGLKWAVNRKTGEEHRANSLPARSKWGRVAAFKTWIHSNDDKKKHEEALLGNAPNLNEGVEHVLQARDLINQAKREKTGNYKYMEFLKKLREKHGAKMSTDVHKAVSQLTQVQEVSVELARKVHRARFDQWQKSKTPDKLTKVQKAHKTLVKKDSERLKKMFASIPKQTPEQEREIEAHHQHVKDSLGKAGVYGVQGKDINLYHGKKAIATHRGLSSDKHFGWHFSIHPDGEVRKHGSTQAALDAIKESDELDQFTTHQHSDENIPPEYNLTDKERKLVYGDNKKKKEKKNMKEASDDWKQRFADDYHDLKGAKNPEVVKHLKQAVHHYDKGNVEDAHYHMQLAKGVKEAVEMPKSVDYSKYDKPTFQRNNPKPERKRLTWAGFNMDKPAYQRKAQADLEAKRLNKEEVEQIKESLVNINEGEYYHEKIAKELPAGLKSEKDVLKHSHEYVKKDLGVKTANYLHHYDQDFPSDLVSNYAHHHKVKLTVESTEEVNEISKRVLGSYIKKASLDAITRQTDYTKEKDINKIKTKGAKITNRFKNIMKATDKIVYNKEDIDEALSDSRDIGFRHGHKGEKQQDFNYRKGSPEQANYIEGYKSGTKAKNVDFLAKFKDRIKHGDK